MKYILFFITLCFISCHVVLAQGEQKLLKKVLTNKKITTQVESKNTPKLDLIKEKLTQKLSKKFDAIDSLPPKKRKVIYVGLIAKITKLIQDENTSQKNKPILRMLKQIIKERKNNLK